MDKKIDYKSAGVDIEKGDLFVEKISTMIRSTYDARVVSGVGGFAALYEMDDDKLLATGTDGVGTKVKLAQELGIHHTIGQDLVAMCVNDILCTGARPMFFLDYLATGKLDLQVSTQIVQGIVNACKMSGCALVGGETAEMPGVYAEGVYDLAGFSVGEVLRKDWLDGSACADGQILIGLKSSGFHSNGYSLVRKLLSENKNDSSENELKQQLLTPTRIYVKLIQSLLNHQRENITGLAHITGGGFHNIPRMNEKLGYDIQCLPAQHDRTPAMNTIIERSGLDQATLFETFNMGIGLVIAVKNEKQARQFLEIAGETVLTLGKISNSFQGLRLPQ
jgi:phosphoribosylformylglycinamidine cyclo-ligase